VYRIVHGSFHNLADVQAFIDTLNRIEQHPDEPMRTLFDPDRDLIVTRAPGRLDVMGGIADYSGSLVLQLPIQEATLVALQRDPEQMLRIISLGEKSGERTSSFVMPLADFDREGQPIDYTEAQLYFRRSPSQHWASYVAGAFLVLMREKNVTFAEGARILITSTVPEGKGVASSAALEVAAMQAIANAFDVKLEPRELALLCQKVENLVVGAPCGVMDQMTAVCGEANRLLALICQPAELREPVTIPEEIQIWGIDSGVRHSVSGSDYTSVRVGAFVGYRIIAELAGLQVQRNDEKHSVTILDPRWNGYLSNILPSEYEERYAHQLPEEIDGYEFLARYGITTDSVTQVLPDKRYSVRAPTAHPIYENSRVNTFAELLAGQATEDRLQLLGNLMYLSHTSYSVCGLGSTGTDRLVNLVRTEGPDHGLYGAKITGGGSGGTVAVLARRGADEAIKRVVSRYADATGYWPLVFRDSSMGATSFGYLRLGKEHPNK
jgi:L-arabinokinase